MAQGNQFANFFRRSQPECIDEILHKLILVIEGGMSYHKSITNVLDIEERISGGDWLASLHRSVTSSAQLEELCKLYLAIVNPKRACNMSQRLCVAERLTVLMRDKKVKIHL